MKDKIEITQADMLSLLAEKIQFLTDEYKSLYQAFDYRGKGKVKTDPLKLNESHTRFLKQEGDINRLIEMFNMFGVEGTTKKTTAKEKD